MKLLHFFIFLSVTGILNAQQIQFHRDFRHTIDPKVNSENFYSFNFDYFNDNDSIGSFLFKAQVDFNGESGNQSTVFIQVSKNFRYWDPDIYLSLGYSGGLGVASPAYGFYISNSYSMGIAYPFQVKGFYCVTILGYRYNVIAKGSHDGHLTFYFWKGLFNYKLSLSGSFVGWTQNKNTGTDLTKNLSGKKLGFFADPQIWYKIHERYSLGSRINLLYNIVTGSNEFKVYPTIGMKYEF